MTRSLRIATVAGLCLANSVCGVAGSASGRPGEVYPLPAKTTEVQNPSRDQPRPEPNLRQFHEWPILVEDPEGVFLYATRGATNVGISPYQNNLAVGFHTLSPAVHRSARCNGSTGFDGFCGDEVAFGDYTLEHDISGRDNTALGDHALANLVSGGGNTAVGSSAAANIRSSGGVDAFGVAACQDATDFRGPITCIGQAALETAGTNSQYSVALGYQAGLHTATAEFSTILGAAAGFSAETNSYSILVGEGACHSANSIRNVICIGTLNGPDNGSLSDRLWLGGNNGGVPILYGDLRNNALGLNTMKLMPGAALTVSGGNIALPAGHAVQWNGDTSVFRVAQGRLAVGTGAATDASGTLELAKITVSSRTTLSASAAGELDVGSEGTAMASGHIVAAYMRTVPIPMANLSAADPSPSIGDRALVTDSKSCTFGVPVVNGGTTTCPVYYNGTVWVAG